MHNAVNSISFSARLSVPKSFKDAAVEGADVLLPIAPFTETAGTFVNAEGRVQSFQGVVQPLCEARPAWKVLRVLGTMLGLPGMGFETADEVRADALGKAADVAPRLSNHTAVVPQVADTAAGSGLERLADVPIYATDALVRRASSLQMTADARPPVASLPPGQWQQLGLHHGDKVRIEQGRGHAVLPARLDATLAEHTVRVPAGHADTASLGAMFGALTVTRVVQGAAQAVGEGA